MPKRFTCTEKWKTKFMRSLPSDIKLFWLYILDNCDHSGIWINDLETANFHLKTELTDEKLAEFKERKIISFDNDEKWFIPSFVKYQYGFLREDNRVHKSVIKKLKKSKLLIYVDVIKPLASPLLGAKDKDKDKDKDKSKKKNEMDEVFERFWGFYPERNGKKLNKGKAKDQFMKLTGKELDALRVAIPNYRASNQIPMDAFRFLRDKCFNDWQTPEKRDEPQKQFETKRKVNYLN